MIRTALGLFVLSILVAGSAPGGVNAADADGRFTVKGAGATACSRFTDAVQSKDAELISFAGWMEGYLSAMNRYEDRVFDIAGWRGTEVMLAALAGYCAANPETGFHEAVAKMAAQMRPAAVTRQTPTVTVDNGDGATVSVHRDTIRRLQSQLALRGLYDGAADGEWSDAVAAALRIFQEEKQVPATGLPDQFTLVHLLP